MRSRGSLAITAVLSTTVSPWRRITAPLACSATRPVSIESRRPATSRFFVTIATSIPPCVMGGLCPEVRFWVRFLDADAEALNRPERELLRADPRYQRGPPELTYVRPWRANYLLIPSFATSAR